MKQLVGTNSLSTSDTCCTLEMKVYLYKITEITIIGTY